MQRVIKPPQSSLLEDPFQPAISQRTPTVKVCWNKFQKNGIRGFGLSKEQACFSLGREQGRLRKDPVIQIACVLTVLLLRQKVL